MASKTFLVVCNSGIGNTVLAVPLILRLRHLMPDAKIICAGKSVNMVLIDVPDLVDGVFHIDCDTNLLVYMLRNRSFFIFDTCFITCTSYNAYKLRTMRLLGIVRRIVGINHENTAEGLLDEALPFDSSVHESDMNLSLIDSRMSPDVLPDLFLRDGEIDAARKALSDLALDKGLFVVFHLGWVPESSYKAFPRSLFLRFVDHVRSLGFKPLVIGSDCEIEFVKRFVDVRRAGIALHASGDIRISASILSMARCLVSVDTGIMHIASAVGTPVIAIFGPSNMARCAPIPKFDGQVHILRNEELELCLGCRERWGLHGCFFNRECLSGIDFDKAKSLLSETLLHSSAS